MLVEVTVNMIVLNLLVAIGAYCGLIFLYESLRSPVSIVKSLIFPNREPFSQRYGSWAVITGSSDGIGKQYALNLAKRGLNVFLISRTESKLADVAREIQLKYPVEVRWLVVDFSDGAKVYSRIQQALSGLEVGILVNNVGMVHRNPCTLDELSERELEETFSVNMQPTTRMIFMLLPEMKRRRRGLIVNVSSVAALATFPYVALYAASKAYLSSLTMSLREELRGTGVECQLVVPLFVSTNINAQWKIVNWWSAIATEVERFTRFAVFTMGRTDYTTGYWVHGVQLTLIEIIPRKLLSSFARIVMQFYRWKFGVMLQKKS